MSRESSCSSTYGKDLIVDEKKEVTKENNEKVETFFGSHNLMPPGSKCMSKSLKLDKDMTCSYSSSMIIKNILSIKILLEIKLVLIGAQK